MKKIILLFILSIFLVSCFTMKVSTKSLLNSIDTNTHTLELSNKGFNKLPKFSKYLSWEVLESIKVIDLSENNLNSITVNELKDLNSFKNLEKLNLSKNKFLLSTNLFLPDHLKELDISNNNLENLVWFYNLKSIKILNLSNNNLEDSDILDLYKKNKLKKLKNLDISWNKISKKLEEKINKINLINNKKG